MDDWNKVLDYWFSPAAEPHWFEGSAAFDDELRQRFSALFTAASLGELADWEGTAQGALALVILLDQIPRNIYRDNARAFATDEAALAAADRAIAQDFDLSLPAKKRQFLYLPFEHSENLADQLRAVDFFTNRTDDSEGRDWAERHLAVIRRFGRFPHRNDALGRRSTQAERDYLAERARAGKPPF